MSVNISNSFETPYQYSVEQSQSTSSVPDGEVNVNLLNNFSEKKVEFIKVEDDYLRNEMIEPISGSENQVVVKEEFDSDTECPTISLYPNDSVACEFFKLSPKFSPPSENHLSLKYEGTNDYSEHNEEQNLCITESFSIKEEVDVKPVLQRKKRKGELEILYENLKVIPWAQEKSFTSILYDNHNHHAERSTARKRPIREISDDRNEPNQNKIFKVSKPINQKKKKTIPYTCVSKRSNIPLSKKNASKTSDVLVTKKITNDSEIDSSDIISKKPNIEVKRKSQRILSRALSKVPVITLTDDEKASDNGEFELPVISKRTSKNQQVHTSSDKREKMCSKEKGKEAVVSKTCNIPLSKKMPTETVRVLTAKEPNVVIKCEKNKSIPSKSLNNAPVLILTDKDEKPSTEVMLTVVPVAAAKNQQINSGERGRRLCSLKEKRKEDTVLKSHIVLSPKMKKPAKAIAATEITFTNNTKKDVSGCSGIENVLESKMYNIPSSKKKKSTVTSDILAMEKIALNNDSKNVSCGIMAKEPNIAIKHEGQRILSRSVSKVPVITLTDDKVSDNVKFELPVIPKRTSKNQQVNSSSDKGKKSCSKEKGKEALVSKTRNIPLSKKMPTETVGILTTKEPNIVIKSERNKSVPSKSLNNAPILILTDKDEKPSTEVMPTVVPKAAAKNQQINSGERGRRLSSLKEKHNEDSVSKSHIVLSPKMKTTILATEIPLTNDSKNVSFSKISEKRDVLIKRERQLTSSRSFSKVPVIAGDETITSEVKTIEFKLSDIPKAIAKSQKVNTSNSDKGKRVLSPKEKHKETCVSKSCTSSKKNSITTSRNSATKTVPHVKYSKNIRSAGMSEEPNLAMQSWILPSTSKFVRNFSVLNTDRIHSPLQEPESQDLRVNIPLFGNIAMLSSNGNHENTVDEKFRLDFIKKTMEEVARKIEDGSEKSMFRNLQNNSSTSSARAKSSAEVPHRPGLRGGEGNRQYKEIAMRKHKNFIQIIILPNAHKCNSLSTEGIKELKQVILLAQKDKDCRIVLLSSSGPFFCSGIDLQLLVGPNNIQIARELAVAIRDLTITLSRCTTPIVAAVNGATIGLGVALLTYCDSVLASDKATFYIPASTLGHIPEGALTVALPIAMRPGLAPEMLLRGWKIDAQQALHFGLVSEVIWPTLLMEETIPRVQAMAEQSFEAMETLKIMVRCPNWLLIDAQAKYECKVLPQQWMTRKCQLNITKLLKKGWLS